MYTAEEFVHIDDDNKITQVTIDMPFCGFDTHKVFIRLSGQKYEIY
jgi:hypothetical protein